MIKRDSFPDILRGFALFGIALVNIPLLAIDPVLHNEGADLTVFSNASAAFVVMGFFQAKFYLLFSFLFGYSAHYVIKDSKANRGRWVGRSIGLVILGILHFSLINLEIGLSICLCMWINWIKECFSVSMFDHSARAKSPINLPSWSWIGLGDYHYDHHRNPNIIYPQGPSKVVQFISKKLYLVT